MKQTSYLKLAHIADREKHELAQVRSSSKFKDMSRWGAMVFLSVLLNAHDFSIQVRIVSLPGLRGPVGLVGHSARFTLMCSAGGPGFDPQIGHLFFWIHYLCMQNNLFRTLCALR